MFCILVYLCLIEGSYSDSDSVNFVEKAKYSSPRGSYYSSLGYPFFHFPEPLMILAGLAFLAYLIQVFHQVHYNKNYSHSSGNNGGLLGGGGLLGTLGGLVGGNGGNGGNNGLLNNALIASKSKISTKDRKMQLPVLPNEWILTK